MKQLFIMMAIAILAACSSPADKSSGQGENPTGNNETEEQELTTEKIQGERIDGPANIRDTVNGKVIFSLEDNVLIETSPEEGNWCQIGINVRLTPKQAEELKIYPNTTLYSPDGKIIGKTTGMVEVWMANEGSGMIGAYTHTDNIKKTSIPERVLENEILKGNLNLNALKNFMENFDFTDYGEISELKYRHFSMYESTVVDPSPRDRITLLFDKEEKLVAVVHSRKLKLEKFKTYDLVRGHSLTVIAPLDKKQINKIISERISFYNSVD